MKNASAELQKVKCSIESSEIFDLTRESNPTKYRILEYELINNLYEYAQLLNSYRYRDMGLEIVETATECLRSFDKDRGSFVNYFMKSLNHRVKKEEALRNANEIRGGIQLPEKVQKQITDIQCLAGKMGREVDDELVIKAASQYLDIPEVRVCEIIRLNSHYSVLHEDKEGETDGLLNLISDSFVLEDTVLERASIEELLGAIDICFGQCRRGQKEVVSKLLTLRIISCPQNIIQMVSNRSFFDKDLYRNYLRTEQLPSARTISDDLKRKESSTSRTLSAFRKRVKEYIEKQYSKE